MVEGNYIGLTNHFQTLDWLINKLYTTKDWFLKLAAPRQPNNQNYKLLSGCASAAQEKYKKYFKKADKTPAYYAAIIINPMLKMEWFYQKQGSDKNKKAQINKVKKKVQDMFKDYKGKSFGLQP